MTILLAIQIILSCLVLAMGVSLVRGNAKTIKHLENKLSETVSGYTTDFLKDILSKKEFAGLNKSGKKVLDKACRKELKNRI